MKRAFVFDDDEIEVVSTALRRLIIEKSQIAVQDKTPAETASFWETADRLFVEFP